MDVWPDSWAVVSSSVWCEVAQAGASTTAAAAKPAAATAAPAAAAAAATAAATKQGRQGFQAKIRYQCSARQRQLQEGRRFGGCEGREGATQGRVGADARWREPSLPAAETWAAW